jgi:hypothetical protein
MPRRTISELDLGVPAALEALSFRRPVYKPLHVGAVFPGEVKELAGGHVGRLFPEERLKAPTQVGTLPRIEAVASSGIPVILNGLEHFLAQWAIGPALIFKILASGSGR